MWGATIVVGAEPLYGCRRQLWWRNMWVDLAHTLGIAPFMFRPLVLLLALGIVSGLVGVIVNLRRLEFNAEAMVHSVFPGIVAGAVFGGIDMIIPAAAALAAVVAVVLAVVSRARFSEPGVAVVLTSFFPGCGVVAEEGRPIWTAST